jgi:hypothetical protein
MGKGAIQSDGCCRCYRSSVARPLRRHSAVAGATHLGAVLPKLRAYSTRFSDAAHSWFSKPGRFALARETRWAAAGTINSLLQTLDAGTSVEVRVIARAATPAGALAQCFDSSSADGDCVLNEPAAAGVRARSFNRRPTSVECADGEGSYGRNWVMAL